MNNSKNVCEFCGRLVSDDETIYCGNNGTICGDCVALINNYIKEYDNKYESFSLDEIPKPKQIKEFLDKYIIGQDRVKQKVAIAVYNHYKRINSSPSDDVEIEKSNICIVGPTGTGKCVSGSTYVKLRNKKTGEVIYDTIDNIIDKLNLHSSPSECA